tara:strand:+ start:223 stop:465 length:243 start_codon:yes stop_codon:yes gene_type:complete
MKILKTIEDKLGSVFNIMALIRTLVCLIFIFFTCVSCGVIIVLPQDSYDKHLIHFHQDGIELPNCEWCSAYSDDDEQEDK